MRSNGPQVIVTCAVCGIATPVTTTVKRIQLPYEQGGTEQEASLQIVVPLIIHCGDGGHLAAHPAMLLEDMGTE